MFALIRPSRLLFVAALTSTSFWHLRLARVFGMHGPQATSLMTVLYLHAFTLLLHLHLRVLY